MKTHVLNIDAMLLLQKCSGKADPVATKLVLFVALARVCVRQAVSLHTMPFREAPPTVLNYVEHSIQFETCQAAGKNSAPS